MCFISCQEEISLDFPVGAQQIVVEGGIEANMPPYVILSKNQGYFDEINSSTYQNLFIKGISKIVDKSLQKSQIMFANSCANLLKS